MDKIKAFFENKIVKIVESVIIALASAGLFIGGVTLDSVVKVPTLTLAIVTAIIALISFIQSFDNKE